MARKILLIRFSSIGDIVLTTPLARALKKQLGAEVHFLTKEAFAPILFPNPYIDKVIVMKDDLSEVLSILREEQYDFIADLHHNLRSLRVKSSLKVPSASFPKLNFEKWLLVQTGINRLPDKHIVERYLETVNSLGIINDNDGLDFFIPPQKEADVSALGITDNKFGVIVIGAAHQTKCLTPQQVATLTEMIPMPVILLGGKNEMKKGNTMLALSKAKEVYNGSGLFDLYQSASVLKQASFIISHDTGMMHIAAALQKPQVVVWGNTVPAFGMYPYYGKAGTKWFSIERQDLRCRPCSKIGYDQCPKGHFRCMLDHDLHDIAQKAMSIAQMI